MKAHWLACALLALLATPLSAQYEISIESAQVAPGGTVDLDVSLDSTLGSDIQGWSYGVCHDAAALQVDAISEGDVPNSLMGGAGPDFNQQALFADGFTVGVVICLLGCEVLPPTAGVLNIGSYTNLMAEGDMTTLSICSTLGMPPVAAVVVENGSSVTPTTVDGTVESFVPPITDFIRGDANGDSSLNIADGIYMLNALFQGGPMQDCEIANDANSDAMYNTADAIFVFNHQFLNGPAPAAPYPDCGTVAGQQPEDCVSSACP